MRHLAIGACLVALLLAGCVPTARPGAVRSSDCSGIPSGACDEQAQRIAATVAGEIRNISLQCMVAACTRAAGAGTAVITMADGRTLTRTWSYVGDPNPMPPPMCVGVPLVACRDQATSLLDQVPPSRHVVGVTVTCRTSCSTASGDADVDFVTADGAHTRMGTSWTTAQP